MGQNGSGPNGTRNLGPRCIALVGPFQSGKTTLLEAILARTGAVQRQGTVDAGTTVGDASKEARHHKMSVEATFATTNFMGDSYTFIDCPGSIEFIQDMRSVLPAVDAAVVVCEADEKKVPQLQLILRELEDQNIPHFLFLNKIDKADKRVRETIKLLQPASRVPLLLRQIPIWNGDIISGFVDLALERAYVYKEHAPSEIIELKGQDLDRKKEARFTMLETLADHDDQLMEQLLEDIEPPRDKVFDDLAKELRDRIVCPVLLGVATRSNGVLRLLKALRHESPGVNETAQRLGVKAGNEAVALVLKTFHTTHGGKMSVARLLAGQAGDGTTLTTSAGDAGRVSGVFKLMGQHFEKRAQATVGETIALGKLDSAKTGDTLSSGKQPAAALVQAKPYAPVLAIAVQAKERKDDVKLGPAFTKLTEEDPSLTVVHNAESHEVVIWGQGEMHLRVAAERLADRFMVPVSTRPPSVGYRETIRKPITQRGRHKKQSGGHGQFGDVVLEIKPLPRGSGFKFEDRITGGVVPRNYIPGGRGRRHRCPQTRAARVSCGRHVRRFDRRLLPHGRLIGSGVQDSWAHRHRGRPAAMPAGTAGADPSSRNCLSDRGDGEDERHPVGAARADPGLRHSRRLGWMGHRARADAGSRDRRSHHRGALSHGRRWLVHLQVRSHGRADGPYG